LSKEAEELKNEREEVDQSPCDSEKRDTLGRWGQKKGEVKKGLS